MGYQDFSYFSLTPHSCSDIFMKISSYRLSSLQEETVMASQSSRDLRPVYGFDEVAIVPGDTTVNPELTDVGFSVDGHNFPLPILAAALDAVVDPNFARLFSRIGGLAVLNLEGLQTRYADADAAIADIVSAQLERLQVLSRRPTRNRSKNG